MELRVVLAAARRGWMLVLAAGALGALAGVLLHFAMPHEYKATASLLLDPGARTSPGVAAFAGDPERYVAGQMRVLESTAMAEQAAARLPGSTTASVQDALELSHVTGDDIVDVAATADTPEDARDIANMVARTYLDERGRQASEALGTKQAAVATELAALEAELKNPLLRRPTPDATVEREILSSRIQQLIAQQASLAQPGVIADETALVEPATAPGDPQRPAWSLLLAGGLLLGALVGLLLATVREMRRPHVASRAHAELVLQRPVLMRFRGLGNGSRRRFTLDGLLPEARMLVAAISGAAVGSLRTLMVCSTARSSGAAPVAAAVAAALVGRDARVALLVLDNGDDVLALLGAPAPEVPQPAVVGNGRAGAALVDGRGWLRAGDWDQGPLGRGSLTAFRAEHAPGDLAGVVDAMVAEFDVVVVYAPALLDSSVAIEAARRVDDVVLVVPVPDQPEPELELARDALGASLRERVHVVTTSHQPARRRAGASRRDAGTIDRVTPGPQPSPAGARPGSSHANQER
jgi:hypothetical protein